MKYKGVRDADDKRAKSVRRIVYSLAVLTMLPSIYLTYNMLKDSRFTMEADKFIAHECDSPTHRFSAGRHILKKANAACP